MKPLPPETSPALPFDDDSRVDLGDGERYETRELLGRGGMGEVHACFDKVVGREVAMKTILPAAREAGLARFVREAKVQARLEHPAIVPVYDIGTREDGTVWFTMKRVRGRSLEDVLDALASGDAETRAEHSRSKLLGAFVAVCYAIAFAHERGVVHRDLKPANIMLGSFGEVSVLDWGIAKITGGTDDGVGAPLAELASGARPTEQGVVVGTPGYMSPEQAGAESGAAAPASDVYALGAILFEILAEKPLHLGATSAEVIASTLAGVVARPSIRGADVPPELDALCEAATALDPTERTASARELARAVERYLDGDRDLERRRVLAAEHAERARSLLGPNLERPSAAARGAALLELGRAIALDAANDGARDLMARLVMTVPDDVPPEARDELDAQRARTRQGAARAGALRYLWWSSFAMLVFWLGVRAWAPTILILSFMGASSAWAFVMTKRATSGYGSIVALLVASSISVALISGLFGPFIIVPTLAATNAMYFAMTMKPRHRAWAIVAAILAIAVPFALESLGVVPPAHDFGASVSSFRVFAQTTYFPAVPTQIVLLLTGAATAIIPVVMVGRLRDALTRAEERLFLQAWQLRATLPADVTRGLR